MKKIFLFILFLVNCTCSFSQQEQDIAHLDFLGIPITGELGTFVSKILKTDRGFSIYKANRANDFEGFTSTTLKGGRFWKFQDCTIHVRYHNEMGFVSSVIVNYNVNRGEESFYDDIVLSYDKKYGDHTETNDNGWIKNIWLVDKGRIVVSCYKAGSFIGIRYEDFPEALIETEKEINKMRYKGHSEDADL